MSDRKPILSGNWKMHLSHLEAIAVLQKLVFSLTPADHERVEVTLHPAFTALRSVQTVLDAERIPIGLGAQNVHWEDKGAYTGEVSPSMLSKLQVRYVIVGHSERRQYFAETDETVNKKVKAVLAAGMLPIVCVGETLEERQGGEGEERVLGQVRAGLRGVAETDVAKLVLAYEPVWAIGTGQAATPEDAQAMCGAIRAALEADHGSAAARQARIQYGGSVKPSNVAELMAEPDVDGALVGSASLDPDEFAKLITWWRQ